MARLLLIGDDPVAGELVQAAVRLQGHPSDLVSSCQDALAQVELYPYDLLMIVGELPGQGGAELCRRIRGAGVSSPLLVLSIGVSVDERIALLEAGADDYLPMPFDPRELSAHVRTLLRRGALVAPDEVSVGPLVLNASTMRVTCGGDPVPLTALEFVLLECMARRCGQVVTRAELVNKAWDENHDPASHALDVHVHRIRAKLASHGGAELIQTRRGFGYVLGELSDRREIAVRSHHRLQGSLFAGPAPDRLPSPIRLPTN